MDAHHPILPSSLGAVLAHFYKQPIKLTKRNHLRIADLNSIAACITTEGNKLRNFLDDHTLAAHILLLHAADLIVVKNNNIQLTQLAHDWLESDLNGQQTALITAIQNIGKWQTVIANWGLSPEDGLVLNVYCEQVLERWLDLKLTGGGGAAGIRANDASWMINIRPHASAKTSFLIFQFAEIQKAYFYQLTPLSVGDAANAGWQLDHLLNIFSSTARAEMFQAFQEDVYRWHQSADAVQLYNCHLLSTRDSEVLGKLLKQRQIKRHLHKRLGSRHAIVSSEVEKPLKQYLSKENKPLKSSAKSAAEIKDNSYLATLVLNGVQKILGESSRAAYPHPDGLLSEAEIANSEQQAAYLLSKLKRAMRGYDESELDPHLDQEVIQQWLIETIEAQKTIKIHYQGAADERPRWRIVVPDWLEQRGKLRYLHAVCQEVDDERIFRLDRIRAISSWRGVSEPDRLDNPTIQSKSVSDN